MPAPPSRPQAGAQPSHGGGCTRPLNPEERTKVSGAPGNEIEGPMAVVTPDGRLTSTALNLIVLPALAMHHEFFAQDINGKNEMERVP